VASTHSSQVGVHLQVSLDLRPVGGHQPATSQPFAGAAQHTASASAQLCCAVLCHQANVAACGWHPAHRSGNNSIAERAAATSHQLDMLARRGHLKLALTTAADDGEGDDGTRRRQHQQHQHQHQQLLRTIDEAWDECSAFCDYWMWGAPGSPGRVRLLADVPQLGAHGGCLRAGVLPPLRLGRADSDPIQAALACLVLGEFGPGDGRSRSKSAVEALTNRRGWFGPGMSAKIAKASGMGKATSYFGGPSLMRLQCLIARDHLAPLYRQQGGDRIPAPLVAGAEEAAERLLAAGADGQITAAYTWLLDQPPTVGGKRCCQADASASATPKPSGELRAALRDFARALQAATAQREKRIQAQLPTHSILQFTDNVANEALLSCLYHPTGGLRGFRIARGDFTMAKGPFLIPTAGGETQQPAQRETYVLRMNLLCAAVHWHWRRRRRAPSAAAAATAAAAHGSRQAGGDACAAASPFDEHLAAWAGDELPAAIRRWVGAHSTFLARFEAELGLHTDKFRKTKLRQPATSGRELLVWTSYHATAARCAEPATDSQSPERSLKRALFFDCMPRRLFSERVWRCLYGAASVASLLAAVLAEIYL
jgi:hypothetical protein